MLSSPPGAREDTLDAIEFLRPPVPTALRMVLRGGFIPPGVCMFRAGLYVGLGGFGIAAAIDVSSGSLGGTLGALLRTGISLGPPGRNELGTAEALDEVGMKSVGEGILKVGAPEKALSALGWLVGPVADCPVGLSLANRSVRSCIAGVIAAGWSCEMACPCRHSGFGRTAGLGRVAA